MPDPIPPTKIVLSLETPEGSPVEGVTVTRLVTNDNGLRVVGYLTRGGVTATEGLDALADELLAVLGDKIKAHEAEQRRAAAAAAIKAAEQAATAAVPDLPFEKEPAP